MTGKINIGNYKFFKIIYIHIYITFQNNNKIFELKTDLYEML